jgi:hypothetical protein
MKPFKQLIKMANENNVRILQLEMELSILENKPFKPSLYAITRHIYALTTKESKEMTFHLEQVLIADGQVIAALLKQISKLKKD